MSTRGMGGIHESAHPAGGGKDISTEDILGSLHSSEFTRTERVASDILVRFLDILYLYTV